MKKNNIPKRIHYCWIGKKEKPIEVVEYINNWREKLSDYEIIEWNEEKFDISRSCKYVREAYEKGKWAFVTDYIRLYALYNEGGIYLDTDVEVIKSFDRLLNTESFIGRESKYSMCTAVIGARIGTKWIGELIKDYNSRSFIAENGKMDLTPNSIYIYKYLEKKYNNFNLNDTIDLKEIKIFGAEYFSPINYNTLKENITNNTYAIHRYNGTWKTGIQRYKDKIKAIITNVIGEENREKIKRYLKS